MPKKTFEAIKEAKGELVVQLKTNQAFLHHKMQQIIKRNKPNSTFSENENNRNRQETRTVTVFALSKQLLIGCDNWHKYLKSCIQVHRVFKTYDWSKKEWTISEETSLYVSSMFAQAAKFATIIRQHWSIENSSHYVKDVTLGEDSSRIRNNPAIFAKLRSFTLNILRANKVKNIRTELFTNCCNIQHLLDYNFYFSTG